jgi:hypothetical protein
MNPLLIAGVGTLTNRLVDRFSQDGPAGAVPAQGANSTSFSKTLASVMQQGTFPPSTDLQQRLLSCPEVRDALKHVDPTKVTSLELSPNGTLATVSPRGRIEIPLSEESKAIARNLFTQESMSRSARLASDSSTANPQSPISIALPVSALAPKKDA